MLSLIHSCIRVSVKSLSLPVGLILLLNSQGATAIPSSQAIRLLRDGINPQAPTLQAQATPPDVVIDTDPQSGSNSPTPTSSDPRFTCEYNGGDYVVMYRPEGQPNQAYPWAVPRALGGGWSADKRCAEISRRLESYRPDGLIELTTGVENNYDTVCVTTQADPSCRIVFTVPPGQDAFVTRDRVFQNLLTADSGQMTQGINTYSDRNGDRPEQLVNQVGQILSSLGGKSRSDGIDLRPFLSRADGGTGAQLRRSTPHKPGQLNPDIFR